MDLSKLYEKKKTEQELQEIAYNIMKKDCDWIRAEDAKRIVDTIGKAVKEKDIKTLKGHLHNENRASRKVFELITGVNLKRTNAGTISEIRSFVGIEYYDKHEKEKRKEIKKEKEKEKERIQKEKDEKIGSEIVRMEGKIMSYKDFITNAFNNGYTKIEKRKNGAVNKYILKNPKTNFLYKLEAKALHLVTLIISRELAI